MGIGSTLNGSHGLYSPPHKIISFHGSVYVDTGTSIDKNPSLLQAP
jgi:hypothetical protein